MLGRSGIIAPKWSHHWNDLAKPRPLRGPFHQHQALRHLPPLRSHQLKEGYSQLHQLQKMQKIVLLYLQQGNNKRTLLRHFSMPWEFGAPHGFLMSQHGGQERFCKSKGQYLLPQWSSLLSTVSNLPLRDNLHTHPNTWVAKPEEGLITEELFHQNR